MEKNLLGRSDEQTELGREIISRYSSESEIILLKTKNLLQE